MSHHFSGFHDASPRGDARLDITDLYAFPNPGDGGRSILILNVHPSAGVNPEGATTPEPFAPEAVYELRIDTNGDRVADVAYRLRVRTAADGTQTATLRRAEGAQAATMGDGGDVVVQGAKVSTTSDAEAAEGKGHRVFVGKRSDPFFFDLRGAMDKLNFKGVDFFRDKDVYSLVLDVPNSALGSGPVGLWARVLMPADGGKSGWVQVERGGRPSQTPFLAGDARAAYLAAEPKDDEQFIHAFAHALEEGPGKYAPDAARRAVAPMLPDILRYDPSRPARYPDNGRHPVDDVSDYFLPILTNGKVKTDGVSAHDDLLAEFPYLGPPHTPG